METNFHTSHYFWAVVQVGYSIFGIGTSKKSAIKDARNWGIEGRIHEGSDCERTHGTVVLVPITEDLYHYLKSGGNPENFEVNTNEHGRVYLTK